MPAKIASCVETRYARLILCQQPFSSGEGQLMAAVDNPSGAHTDTLVTDNEDGTYSVSYTPFEEGIHTLSVKFGGDHIPGSPFKVRVQFTSCSF